MENYQKAEQIVNKTGCSFEEAQKALEDHGWDILDAVISLEKDEKINKETAEHSVQSADEPIEVTAEVSKDGISGEYTQKIEYSTGKSESKHSGSSKEEPKRRRRLLDRIKSIFMKNRMVILKNDGSKFVDLPILIPVIALLAFFWGTLTAAVIAMIFGYRFHFEGEDLGKASINDTMDKATDYAEKVREDLTNRANGR